MPWPSRSSRLPFPHVTRLRLPVLLLAGLTLSACGSEPVPEQLAAPAKLPSPSASASRPAAGDAPAESSQPPEQLALPASTETPAATAGDAAAADAAEVEQFVRDYYAAANVALETGDVESLEPFSIPQCEYCRHDMEFIKRNSARGTIEGSRTTVRSVTVQDVGPEMASVLVDLVAPDGRVVGPDGATVVVIDNGDGGPAVHALFRTPDGWKIAQVLEE
jgi:hypothetical protein